MDIDAALSMGRQLMDTHGLKDWSFQVINLPSILGCCFYPNDDHDGVIALDYTYVDLNDEDSVKDTVLHEIAHAFTRGDGHGKQWKAKCLEIGAIPSRRKDNFHRPAQRYRTQCQKCLKIIYKARKPRRPHCCIECGMLGGILVWTDTRSE